MQSDGADVRQLTVNAATDHRPTWSPDGTRIAFHSDRDGDFEIYTMRSDSTDVRQLTVNDDRDWSPAWSPDGTRIAFEWHADLHAGWGPGGGPRPSVKRPWGLLPQGPSRAPTRSRR